MGRQRREFLERPNTKRTGIFEAFPERGVGSVTHLEELDGALFVDQHGSGKSGDVIGVFDLRGWIGERAKSVAEFLQEGRLSGGILVINAENDQSFVFEFAVKQFNGWQRLATGMAPSGPEVHLRSLKRSG